MSYWAAHWDWECPTVFGIELEELQVVLEAWPHCSVDKEIEASAMARSENFSMERQLRPKVNCARFWGSNTKRPQHSATRSMPCIASTRHSNSDYGKPVHSESQAKTLRGAVRNEA